MHAWHSCIPQTASVWHENAPENVVCRSIACSPYHQSNCACPLRHARSPTISSSTTRSKCFAISATRCLTWTPAGTTNRTGPSRDQARSSRASCIGTASSPDRVSYICLLTHRLHAASTVNDRCKPRTCPGAYLALWSLVKDKGEQYLQSLLHHWHSLQGLKETPTLNFGQTFPAAGVLKFSGRPCNAIGHTVPPRV